MNDTELELVSGGIKKYLEMAPIIEGIGEFFGGFAEGWNDGYKVKSGTTDVSGIRPGEAMA